MKRKHTIRSTRSLPRSSVILALVIEGNISRLAGKKFAKKKGKGAKYDRKVNKAVQIDD